MIRLGVSKLTLDDVVDVARGEMRVLYASGYTRNAIVHQGVLQDRTQFLQKPYVPAELSRKVREVLDRSE